MSLGGGNGSFTGFTCSNIGSTAPVYFKVTFGTCNAIIVDLSGSLFGPFTPSLCCPCSNIKMSATLDTTQCGGGGEFHLDIH